MGFDHYNACHGEITYLYIPTSLTDIISSYLDDDDVYIDMDDEVEEGPNRTVPSYRKYGRNKVREWVLSVDPGLIDLYDATCDEKGAASYLLGPLHAALRPHVIEDYCVDQYMTSIRSCYLRGWRLCGGQ